jgi:hypothetical protein
MQAVLVVALAAQAVAVAVVLMKALEPVVTVA